MKSTTFCRLRASAAKSPITPLCQVSERSAGASFVLAAALLVAATTPPTASAQSVTYAGTGAVNFGSVNVCPSGKATPAPCSQTFDLVYNVVVNSTLSAIKVLTTGLPNLDYTLASGSTCIGVVTAGTTCIVKVNFAPIAPGARNGAVEILDDTGTVTRTTFLHGTGIGPLIGLGTPSQRSFGSGLVNPYDVAVDAGGNVFVADFGDGLYGDNKVKELLAVNGSLPANPAIKDLAGYPKTAGGIW